jgi:hypothetical protein
MSNKHSDLAKLPLLVLMLIGGWLVHSEASFLVGFILVMGSLAGIVVITRRENILPLGHGEREGWESVRAKGKRHYILRSLMYGLFVGSLFLLYQVIRSLWSGEPFTASSGFLLVALFILLYIGGSYYAAIMKWALYEERYKESLPQEPQHNNGMQRTRN